MKFPQWIRVFGSMEYRGACPVESAEQTTFFAELRRRWPDTLGRVAIHPRNEGKRTHRQTQRHKMEGMCPGASDIVIPGSPAFVCELKRRDHTKCKWEEDQLPYLEAAEAQGAWVCVALGWEAAMQAVEEWAKSQHLSPAPDRGRVGV